jgi:hypothetical protein
MLDPSSSPSRDVPCPKIIRRLRRRAILLMKHASSHTDLATATRQLFLSVHVSPTSGLFEFSTELIRGCFSKFFEATICVPFELSLRAPTAIEIQSAR